MSTHEKIPLYEIKELSRAPLKNKLNIVTDPMQNHKEFDSTACDSEPTPLITSVALYFKNYRFRSYSMISVTTPEPTVLPPSLIANLSPSSIAIGVIRSISIVTLSPGIHISVPSGSFRSPVTSVVLK